MPDQESAAEAKPRPRGVTVYAVEAALIGLAQFAWALFQWEVGRGLVADAALLAPAGVVGCATLLATAVARDNAPILDLAAAVVEQLFVGYAYLLAEASAGPDFARLFFADDWLALAQGAVSLALLAVHTLLAFAAVGERLGDTPPWFDAGLLLVQALLAAALIATGRPAAGAALLAAGAAFLAAGVIRSLVRRATRLLAAVHSGLAVCLAGLGVALAFAMRLTGGAHAALTLLLLVVHLVRSYATYRESRANGPQGAVNVHIDQPRQAPHDPTAARHRPPPIHMLSLQTPEAILFANRSRLLRTMKKSA